MPAAAPVTAPFWYGDGMEMVWRWYGDGMDLVWTWYGLGMDLVWTWYGLGTVQTLSKSVLLAEIMVEGGIRSQWFFGRDARGGVSH